VIATITAQAMISGTSRIAGAIIIDCIVVDREVLPAIAKVCSKTIAKTIPNSELKSSQRAPVIPWLKDPVSKASISIAIIFRISDNAIALNSQLTGLLANHLKIRYDSQ
jgi:hypothetical protein